MLSRNNWKEQVRQQEPKKQRFTIKKLTIGVASVLIGFTFMGMSASANTQNTPGTPAANTQNTPGTPAANMNANASSTKGQSNNAANSSVQTAQSGATSYYNNALSLYTIGDSDDSTDSDKYQVTYFPMHIERPTTDTPVTKAQTPMMPYMMPDGTITGYKLTGDTHGAPFNPPKGLTASVDSKTGKLTVTVAKDVTTDDFTIMVDIDYQDGSGTFWYVPVHIKNYADQYIPAYNDTTVAANSSVNTGSPSFTKDSNPVKDVPGHTYAFNDGTTKMTINDKNGKNPVTVTIDKTSGAITFTAPDDATEYDIPVTVTYKDGSSNTATAKVFVNKSLDPTKVDPTNPEYKEMFKTVTRDIVTTSVSGQQTTEPQVLDFGRTMTIYGNGDHATYGNWEALSADKFASKNITPVDGYTSYYKIGNDGQKVYASAVPSASVLYKDGNPVDGTTVYVGYDKNNTPTPTENTTVTYTFYDDTDKKLVKGHDVTVTGQPGTDQKVNLTTPEGYKLAEGQTLPTSVTMPKANETITIHLVHATKDIKPNDPGVNPSDPAYADMFKTVTRTIKVNNPDRMVDTTTQQVNFNRTKTIDEVTDEVISYGNWTLATGSAKDWGQFNVPQLDGFISYVDGNAAKEVAEENVTADTADVTVEVTYKNSDNNGNNTNPGDDGNHNTNPGDNGNHNTNPGNNNGINNGTQNGNGNKTVNTNVTNNGNGDNSQNNKQALPQTGNTKNDAAVAGLGLAGLLAMLGLGGLKKKRN